MIGSLQVFDLIYMVIDKSNPALTKTQSLVYLFYKYAFINKNMGYGATIVVVLLIITMILTVFQMIGQKKMVGERSGTVMLKNAFTPVAPSMDAAS